MCGPTSAIGLEEPERALWWLVRHHFEEPGRFVGLMRGFLADREVAAIVTTAVDGAVRPVAVLVSADIEAELVVGEDAGAGWSEVGLGDYRVEVFFDVLDESLRPVAVRMTPWMHEYLVLYARRLWGRRR
jgi:hypothetical protein